MRQIVQTAQFKTDLKKVARSGHHQVSELLKIANALASDELLAAKHRDHALLGRWGHHRECHIRPDWLLIYKLEPGRLILVRTGSHSDLF